MSVKLRVVKPNVTLETPAWWFSEMAPLIEVCGRKSHKSEEKIGDLEDVSPLPKVVCCSLEYLLDE